MILADSHAHLDFSQFDTDRDQVLERAWGAGVRHLLAIGGAAGPDRLRAALEMVEGKEWVWATVGIHPHEARLAKEEHLAELARLAKEPRVVAVGEIGLDYHYDHSPREIQRKLFLRQLEVAEVHRLPVVIHCREAWGDCLRILEDHWKRTGLGGILHCFSGSVEDARRGMGAGFCVSFAGNLTFPKAVSLRGVAAKIPADRLLVETDSPFLAPVPHRGQRNEPAYVRFVVEQLAALRGSPAEEVAEATTQNFLAFLQGARAQNARAAPDS